MSGEGIGFGKAILFNEHFVVYKVPAIVSAIGRYTVAKIEPISGSGWKINDNRKATPNYKEDKIEQQKDSINKIDEVASNLVSQLGDIVSAQRKSTCPINTGETAETTYTLYLGGRNIEKTWNENFESAKKIIEASKN